MALVFGDPASIEIRDKARHAATYRDCETCHGTGYVQITYRCRENKKCGIWRMHEHDVEVECRCCEGEGELERD